MDSETVYNSPNLAKKIKEIAKQKNIVLRTILEECNLGSNTFSHMSHGKMISAGSLALIADYLDCSVDYLLGRTTSVSNANENVKQLGLSDSDSELVTAILSLDKEDKAEIRGTVKQMLKAEKYNVQNQKRA